VERVRSSEFCVEYGVLFQVQASYSSEISWSVVCTAISNLPRSQDSYVLNNVPLQRIRRKFPIFSRANYNQLEALSWIRHGDASIHY